jgi:hypothetical protein
MTYVTEAEVAAALAPYVHTPRNLSSRVVIFRAPEPAKPRTRPVTGQGETILPFRKSGG